MAEAALALESCTKLFGREGAPVHALNQVSATVRAGRITGLLGPDGAGKTTLLRLAAALLLPDSGRVSVLGMDTRSEGMAIQQRIGYMPQRFGLYEELTVQENLDLYAALQGLSPVEKAARQQELLALTALGPFGGRRAGQLSGGMKQKLGLACALLRSPSLLLLDEPTVGVDPISRRELWHIIENRRAAGVSVLISTAYLDEAERCEDILLLHEGRLLVQDTQEALQGTLSGRCYRVRREGTPRRQLRTELAKRPGVLDATIQADGVRVLVEGGSPPAAPSEQWDAVSPRFEDAFVNLLRGQAASLQRPEPPPPPRRDLPRAQDGPAVIEVKELWRRFGNFDAVKGISFQVQAGQVFGLLGANGAGKTTTFNMLCGLLSPTSGTLRVAGQNLGRAAAAARARIGYVSQKFALYGNLSVLQNLDFFASVYGLGRQQRAIRRDWALSHFSLAPYARVNGQDLPLGFKQRLALACALLHEPLILFLDEPTSGVDPLARREFWSQINGLAESGVTILVTTHFMEEAEYCDELVLMSQGEILAQGSPQAIRSQAATRDLPSPTMEDAFIALVQAHEAGLRRAS
ncbi:MAG: ABC transporter ATP-binding protein [Betaproteobacteria bacterium]|nr:ABC transporter ATP-binding protein [Betaproteobacteria bacterium]MDE2623029.1 ABC transporter ATP-binding protein [Betaproteobacteria bacterium]